MLMVLVSACSTPANHADTHNADHSSGRLVTGLTPAKAAVASAHPLATEAGLAVLRDGGNAFDAAIAVAASLGVVEPYSAGLGGGGFWLLYDARQQQYRFIDARETAPAAASATYFQQPDGSVNRDKALNGPTAAAIPGQVAAFAHIAERYGKLPLRRTLAPAIAQARNGFAVDDLYRTLLAYRLDAIRRYPQSAAIFLDDGDIPDAGFVLRQPALADTLQAIARDGADAFYRGAVSRQLLQDVHANGGDWTAADLAGYQVKERTPLHVQYGPLHVISAPPPSSGGVALIEMLNMLSHFNWQGMTPVNQTHLLTEVMRRAYRDRAEFLGDPDFVDVPVSRLIAEQHAQEWADSIDMTLATPSESLNGPGALNEGFHTTHLSVMDTEGNIVSATLSINLPFGSAFTSAGVVLNNEMDDFSSAPGSPNAYGLVGAQANAIAPGKRPLSSMTPTIISSPDSTAILGTPGGSRIISMVLLGTLEHLQGRSAEQWVSRPRFHHQYLPDVLQHEPDAFTGEQKVALTRLGHRLQTVGRQYGNMQAILWDKTTNTVTAASDPRGIGEARTAP
ncbi:gamma-glutamyltransferase [Thalassolituus sp. LLYu03]|uniref:gamma-glutamyltransferase n=1 Tax=Thalassolituus sp. LLYu03 TaxID=3421656 RepID=UPI003D291A46